MIETLRGVLFGIAIGSNGILAVAWSVAIALVSYVWAEKLYNRDPVRSRRRALPGPGQGLASNRSD